MIKKITTITWNVKCNLCKKSGEFDTRKEARSAEKNHPSYCVFQ